MKKLLIGILLVGGLLIPSQGGSLTIVGGNVEAPLVPLLACPGLTRVSSLTLNSGENNATNASLDLANGFIYYSTDTNPIIVIKVRISDFTRVAAITLATNGARAQSIDTTNGFLYVVGTTNIISKINISPPTFAFVSSITLTGFGTLQTSVIDIPNQRLYLGEDANPGHVARVNLSTFTYTVGDFVTTAAGKGNLRASDIDLTAGKAYFVGNNSPVSIIKVDLPSFVINSTLTMNAGENLSSAREAAIDFDKAFLYFELGLTGGIGKVRLSDFSRIGFVVLTGGSPAYPIIPFPNNNLGFFGTSATPAQLKTVDLSTFTQSVSLTLNSGEGPGDWAVMDTTTGFIYISTFKSPSTIVKVSC